MIMIVPLTESEVLMCVARETARLSYPGSMSRGSNAIVRNGNKKALETYFAEKFLLKDIWSSPDSITERYASGIKYFRDIKNDQTPRMSPKTTSSSGRQVS